MLLQSACPLLFLPTLPFTTGQCSRKTRAETGRGASEGLEETRSCSERYVMASTAVLREKSLSPAALRKQNDECSVYFESMDK